VTTIVGSLSFAGCGTGDNSLGESWVVGQGEELVAHVSVGLGLWVKRSVDSATKSSRALETILCCWRSELVVSVRSSNNNRELSWISVSTFPPNKNYIYIPLVSPLLTAVAPVIATPHLTHLMLVKEAGFAQLGSFGFTVGSRS
jgi:hypothetical protein